MRWVQVWARTGGAVRVTWYRYAARRAARGTEREQRILDLSRRAWYGDSEGLSVTDEQRKAFEGKGRRWPR